MLRVEALRSGYTGVDVLKGVSLAVPDRAIVGVLGPNGAGKTALLRAISQLNPVRGGRIVFDDADLTDAGADGVVRKGVIHVPQGRMLFGSMTVRENLELGAYLERDRAVIRGRLARVHELFPVLGERSAQAAAYLSGGEQQMLALGRALMLAPKILLIDEPSVGLAPLLVARTIDAIKEMKEKYQLTVLMAEQNFTQAVRIADRGYVIVHGRIAVEGRSAEELNNNELIRKFYLGL
jgi:branched-chain amino acid transport system ATP-binding protein